MSAPAGVFDADVFSLEPGVRLLEASAGTGKTFALAHLVLRLVLERGLPLAELLVVTFTNAAAAELRDRIGRRLQQALTALEPAQQALPTFPDPVLERWFARQPVDRAGRRQLMGRLLLALDDLDRADITTLHGFGQRSLRRQALEAGLAPDLEIDPEARTLVRQVAHDYWQAQVVALPVELLKGVLSLGVTPGALEDQLAQLESDPSLELDPLPQGLDPSEPLAPQLVALWEERWNRFQALWAERAEGLEESFKSSAAQWRSEGADPKPYVPKPTKDRIGLMTGWLETQPKQGSYAALLEQKELRDYFHPGPFSAAARRAGEEDPPCRRRRCCERSPIWWRGRPKRCCSMPPMGAARSWPAGARAVAAWDMPSCWRGWTPARRAPTTLSCWRHWGAATGWPWWMSSRTPIRSSGASSSAPSPARSTCC